MAKKPPAGYEDSRFDRDKGVKEGSRADMKRDAKAIPKFQAAKRGETKVAMTRELGRRMASRDRT